jgi:hypothetical protein
MYVSVIYVNEEGLCSEGVQGAAHHRVELQERKAREAATWLNSIQCKTGERDVDERGGVSGVCKLSVDSADCGADVVRVRDASKSWTLCMIYMPRSYIQ